MNLSFLSTRGSRDTTRIRAVVSRGIARLTEAVLPPGLVKRLRTRREWLAWVDSLTADLFDDSNTASPEAKRSLFLRNVKLVEIEVHARCNRVCSFCPNSIVDRRRNTVVTDAELLDRVFDELGAIGYSKQIKIARYSEPLANLDVLYERLASARQRVPRADLAVVTNTDYLTRASLDRLRDAGLNTLYMSLYLKANERWSLELARDYSTKLGQKLGVPRVQMTETPVSVRCVFEYHGVNLYSACMNFDSYGSDRGDLLDQYKGELRQGPCREPFETVVIDYTGVVMPCCNLRSDVPAHDGFGVGNLNSPGSSVVDTYVGALAAWRRSMAGFGAKESPCSTCTHRDIPEGIISEVSKALDVRMREIGV